MAGETLTWTYDTNKGILKNYQLSKMLRKVAAGKCIITPHTHSHGINFKPNAGEGINLMYIERLPNSPSSQLQENNRIPIRKTSFGNRIIKVVELGEGVEYTNLMERLSTFNIKDEYQKLLATQMEEALDTFAANQFKSATDVPLVFTPTSLTSGTFATNGTPGAAATAGMTFDHCGILADYLRDTIHCPPYEGDRYLGITANKNYRSMKNDRNWQEWNKYLGKGDFVFKGEMGETEGIRWVVCYRALAFSNVAGTSSYLGQAVVFGDDAVARITAESPHLRLDTNYQSDFGRTQAAAWYGIIGIGSVWTQPDDGKAKIIRIDSL